ncbi:MAG: hypothetical protein HY042_07015 [Spirochaetia bacterium]|nr:hypothetical protein [Spirochaetia bacterium]
MDIRNVQCVLRKRRLDEIFDLAVLFSANNVKVYLRYVAPACLLVLAFNVLVIRLVRTPDGSTFKQQSAMFLLLLMERILVALPVVLISGRLMFDERPAFKSLIQASWKSLFPFVVARFVGLVQVTVLAPFVIPLWIGVVRNAFLDEVILLEQLRFRDASRRLASFAVERVPVFIFLDLVFMAAFLAVGTMTFGFLLDVTGLAGTHWMLKAGVSLMSPLFHLLVLCYFVFQSIARFLFYIDTRSRSEGWDTELMLLNGVRETDEGA